MNSIYHGFTRISGLELFAYMQEEEQNHAFSG